MQLNTDFIAAVKDYLFLLEKAYPQKASLKLVSDRYNLNTQERSMLFRGVVTRKQRELRISKTTDNIPAGSKINIDGFNVIRSVASYLLGRPVYIAMDGFLRDASELHGKPLKTEIRIKAFLLILDVLKEKNLNIKIWLDSPVSNSGETAASINKILANYAINGNAETVHSADYELKLINEGIIATADSAIIENSKVQVVDLARLTLQIKYKPNLLNLQNLI